MKYLLDTHALLWFMRETYHLPPPVVQTIEDAGSEAVVSIASLWEIAIKISLDKSICLSLSMNCFLVPWWTVD